MPYVSKAARDRKLWITPKEAVAHVCKVERCNPTEAQDQILLALTDENIGTRWGDAVPVGYYKNGQAKFGADSVLWGADPYCWADTIINWDTGTTFDPRRENINFDRRATAKRAGKKPPKLLNEERPLLLLKSRVMILWPTPNELDRQNSPILEPLPDGPTSGSKPRKPRNRDTEKDALLRNSINQVLAAARTIKGGMELRPLSQEVYKQKRGEHFSAETVRKILAGTYPAQKRLGIAGLK